MWRFLDPVLVPLRRRWGRWLLRRHPQGTQVQVLLQHRVYIFLSGSGVIFVAVVLAMLGGAVNYDLALAYLMVFLLVSMALVSLFHTFRNLVGLRLQQGSSEGCFVGERARFEVVLENTNRTARHRIQLGYGKELAPDAYEIPPGDTLRAWLTLPAPTRGWLYAPRLRVDTHWPIGVFHAWSYAFFDQRALIYPVPEADPPALPTASLGLGTGVQTPRGQDDFAGLRAFQRGDSPRHIAWKAAARGESLQVKEFHGEASQSLWLDWDALPHRMLVEEKLSRLTAWVIEADASGLAYGLSIPGTHWPPGSGEGHRHACLAALALFGEHGATAADERFIQALSESSA
ncbi:MAG: DUF58 domain-containing protein [Burkholderiales bacterium]|nr:DUF58 domain-containing protein [Burkholderiales bacterium]